MEYQAQGEPTDLHNKIERLEAEIARLREQLAAADVKLLDAGYNLRLRDAAIACLREMLEDVSTVPCCECHGPVVEFSRSNAEWNATMRPDGHETNREYLCAACYMTHLATRAETAEARVAAMEVLLAEVANSSTSPYRDGPGCWWCIAEAGQPHEPGCKYAALLRRHGVEVTE